MKVTVTKVRDSGAQIVATVERGVHDKSVYADGQRLNTGKETFHYVTVKIVMNGKVLAKGSENFIHELTNKKPNAFARVGDAFVNESVYNSVCEAIAEAEEAIEESAEIAEVAEEETKKQAKAEKNMAEIEAMEQQRRQNSGWCDKCQSYCYGDCEAND